MKLKWKKNLKRFESNWVMQSLCKQGRKNLKDRVVYGIISQLIKYTVNKSEKVGLMKKNFKTKGKRWV